MDDFDREPKNPESKEYTKSVGNNKMKEKKKLSTGAKTFLIVLLVVVVLLGAGIGSACGYNYWLYHALSAAQREIYDNWGITLPEETEALYRECHKTTSTGKIYTVFSISGSETEFWEDFEQDIEEVRSGIEEIVSSIESTESVTVSTEYSVTGVSIACAKSYSSADDGDIYLAYSEENQYLYVAERVNFVGR